MCFMNMCSDRTASYQTGFHCFNFSFSDDWAALTPLPVYVLSPCETCASLPRYLFRTSEMEAWYFTGSRLQKDVQMGIPCNLHFSSADLCTLAFYFLSSNSNHNATNYRPNETP